MNFVSLSRLGHDRNYRFNGRTTRFVTLKLADGDGHVSGQFECFIGPGLESLNGFRASRWLLLLEQVHTLLSDQVHKITLDCSQYHGTLKQCWQNLDSLGTGSRSLGDTLQARDQVIPVVVPDNR